MQAKWRVDCSNRACLVLLLLVIMLFLGSVSVPVYAQPSSWNSAWWESIKEEYYLRGKPDQAIQKLDALLEDKGNTYPDETLTEMITMMDDYFGKVPNLKLFRKMLFNMLEPARVGVIVDSFQKSPKLYQEAKGVRETWRTPEEATIKVNDREIDIDRSTGFSVVAYNKKKVRLSSGDLEGRIDIELDDPDGCATLDKSNKRIRGKKEGQVTLIVKDANGKRLNTAVITILPSLDVSIEPTRKDLTVGESHTFTVKSNKPLEEVKPKITVEPRGLLDIGKSTQSEHKKEFEVHARKSGTAYLRVEDAQGRTLGAEAQIYILPLAPSMRYSLIGSGVTVALGVYSIIAWSSASGKYDDYESCVNTTGGECRDLYGEYDDKIGQAQIFGIIAGVAAAGTGYLWYRYFKAKGNYQRALESAPMSSGFEMEMSPSRVAFTYHF